MKEKKLRKLICKNLRRIRRSKDFSQEYVALVAKTERVHISNIECGKVNLSIDMIERIMNALEVKPEDLLQKQ